MFPRHDHCGFVRRVTIGSMFHWHMIARMDYSFAWPPREISPGNLVGARVACERYGISRGTLTRRIQAGLIVPLEALDGAAYVFDERDLPEPRS